MIKGKTQTGFEYELNEKVLNNYELVENIAEIEENPLAITTIVKQLLGKAGTKRLKEHIREENGNVTTDKMQKEIVDIFQNSGKETKNS